MSNRNNNNLFNYLNNNDIDISQLFAKADRIMVLKLFVSGNTELKNVYIASIIHHNTRLFTNQYIDSGVDIFNPFQSVASSNQLNKIDFFIKCEAYTITDTNKIFPTGFHMYPRSSLSKTPLRLANSVGIIDAGYRGNLIGAFDCKIESFQTTEYDRYAQICAPTLCPVYVILVENEQDLEETERGGGGFGSTGR